jgi:hypothetical protein
MREIKFRAWHSTYGCYSEGKTANMFQWIDEGQPVILEQFTGLLDKNGLTEVYERDIVGENGLVKGNIHENKGWKSLVEQGIDFVVTGMGTKAWRDTEQKLLGCGCRHTE